MGGSPTIVHWFELRIKKLLLVALRARLERMLMNGSLVQAYARVVGDPTHNV